MLPNAGKTAVTDGRSIESADGPFRTAGDAMGSSDSHNSDNFGRSLVSFAALEVNFKHGAMRHQKWVRIPTWVG
jgi:hypothetical protein